MPIGQPMIKIGAEPSLLHSAFQRHISGSDNPDIDLYRALPANPLDQPGPESV